MRFDARYLRPTEVDSLIGDARRPRRSWVEAPTTLTPDLARLMVDADVALLSQPAVANRV